MQAVKRAVAGAGGEDVTVGRWSRNERKGSWRRRLGGGSERGKEGRCSVATDGRPGLRRNAR